MSIIITKYHDYVYIWPSPSVSAAALNLHKSTCLASHMTWRTVLFEMAHAVEIILWSKFRHTGICRVDKFCCGAYITSWKLTLFIGSWKLRFSVTVINFQTIIITMTDICNMTVDFCSKAFWDCPVLDKAVHNTSSFTGTVLQYCTEASYFVEAQSCLRRSHYDLYSKAGIWAWQSAWYKNIGWLLILLISRQILTRESEHCW